jgi:hypothetical protein
MRLRTALVALSIIFLPGFIPAQAQQVVTIPPRPLTNQDVVRMVKAKFDDATILKAIETRRSSFDLSVDGLVRLKDAGVSQAVIQAMLATGGEKKPASIAPAAPSPSPPSAPLKAAPSPPEFPDEVGVYEIKNEKLITIEPEIVNWRTGGVIKSTVTLGFDKQHVNGTVAGPNSQLSIASGREIGFYIRCLEGNSASEYQLLRFWEKADRREFRSVTGGVLHASGGAENNVIAFRFEKLVPRTYRIELPNLAVGEYGFLAPGAAASADLASRGKVYTFRIVD